MYTSTPGSFSTLFSSVSTFAPDYGICSCLTSNAQGSLKADRCSYLLSCDLHGIYKGAESLEVLSNLFLLLILSVYMMQGWDTCHWLRGKVRGQACGVVGLISSTFTHVLRIIRLPGYKAGSFTLGVALCP